MDYLQALKLVLNEADNALDKETSLANSVLLKTAIEKVEHNYNSEATKHNEQIEPATLHTLAGNKIYRIGCSEEIGGYFNVSASSPESAEAIAKAVLDNRGFVPSLLGFDVKHGNRQVLTVELINKHYPFEEGDTYYTVEASTVITSTWDDESENIHDSTPNKKYFSSKEDAEHFIQVLEDEKLQNDDQFADADDWFEANSEL